MAGSEQELVAQLVRSRVIDDWEAQDESLHLKTIRDRILANEARSGRLLGLYQRILQDGEVTADGSEEQIELRLSGLIREEQNCLRVANPIYAAVFDRDWVERGLLKLRPYGAAIAAWLASGQQDQSRLLQGQALQDALLWANESRSLDDEDRLFLSASQAIEQADTQTRLDAEAEANHILAEARGLAEAELAVANQQLIETEAETALLMEQGRKTRRSTTVIAGVALTVAALATLWGGHRGLQANNAREEAKAAKEEAQKAGNEKDGFELAVEEAKQNLSQAGKNLQAAERKFQGANKQAQEAAQVAQAAQAQVQAAQGQLSNVNAEKQQAEQQAQQAVQATEAAIIAQRTAETRAQQAADKLTSANVALASAATEQATVAASLARARVGLDLERKGAFALQRFKTNQLDSLVIAMEAGQRLKAEETSDPDKTQYPAYSPLVALDTILRNIQELNQLEGHQAGVSNASFSPDGSRIVTASDDNTARVWDSQSGELIQTLEGHQASVFNASFSPDGSRIVTASDDNTARVWDSQSGELIQTLEGHQAGVRNASFSPDGSRIVTASYDNTARVWNSYDLDGLLALGCDHLTPYFMNHPEDLETLTICQTPARKLAAAPAYVREGDALAAQGKIEQAIKLYEFALVWKPSLDVDPSRRAQTQSAPFFIQQGASLAQSGDIPNAIESFQSALSRDPNLKVDPNSWNGLCWDGSLAGYAQDVLLACEKAVELTPQDGGILDSRGLARALTGDFRGAIADFEAFIAWTDDSERKAQRQAWIQALQAGQNPFTPDVLESIKDQ